MTRQGQEPFFGVGGEYLGSVNAEDMEDCRHPCHKIVGECSAGCCDHYECLDCGKRFRVECPD